MDSEGQVLRSYDPLSSYPHHAAFSHDSTQLFVNSCHLYGGCTLAAPLGEGVAAAPENAENEDLPVLNSDWRVCTSATLPGVLIVGHAYGYLHAADGQGKELWRHHVGSTMSAIDVSPDGQTIVAASYGGYLVHLQRSDAGIDPYSIGTSPYTEVHRWIFWDKESAPLRW